MNRVEVNKIGQTTKQKNQRPGHGDASKNRFLFSAQRLCCVCVAVWIVYKQEFDHKIIIIIHMSAHTRRIMIFHSIWWCSHSQYQIHYRLPVSHIWTLWTCEMRKNNDKRHKLTHSVSQVNQCIFIWRFHTDPQPKCSQIRYSTACHTPHWHPSEERTWEKITKCSIPYALIPSNEWDLDEENKNKKSYLSLITQQEKEMMRCVVQIQSHHSITANSFAFNQFFSIWLCECIGHSMEQSRPYQLTTLFVSSTISLCFWNFISNNKFPLNRLAYK